ncbi:MAG: hypothetical protein ACQET7_13545, partial [Thermodesulfobacteriota bacterium]
PDSDFDPEETKLDAHSSRQCSLTLGCGQGPALEYLKRGDLKREGLPVFVQPLFDLKGCFKRVFQG